MAADPPEETGLQMRSRVRGDGTLELFLERVPVPEPSPDEVVVRVEAAPINPSDLGLLLAGADADTARAEGSGADTVTTLRIPEERRRAAAGREGQALPVGNEGAGVVVGAGGSPAAQALLGRTVAMLGGAMYARYRVIPAAQCLVLPEGTPPRAGASCFVNPLTALGMVETLRREGHTALVHTAAASNLGRMLNRLCLEDGVPLVNVVRRPAQVEILSGLGAKHVCDSSAREFMRDLVAAVKETGATLAFDAVGGGDLASRILTAMEAAASAGAEFSRYGSTVHKQVYIYGGLDPEPTVLKRAYGMAWGVGGWLLPNFLQKIGPEAAQSLRERVAREIETTFASDYAGEISLAEALRPEVLAEYARQATGEKYLIDPSREI